jgi:hypothetical protein
MQRLNLFFKGFTNFAKLLISIVLFQIFKKHEKHDLILFGTSISN